MVSASPVPASQFQPYGSRGVLLPWTPVVVGGVTPSLTVNRATYSQVGRRVTAEAVVTLTSGTTAANVITMTLPVPATSCSVYSPLGTAKVFKASSVIYWSCLAMWASASVVKFEVVAIGGADQNYIGNVTYTTGLLAGDIISMNITYEAAADAR